MEGKGKKAILRLLAPAAVAAAACLACFFIVWFAYLRGSESKAKSVELNGDFSADTAPLAEGETTQQTFTSKGALYAVGVVFRKLDDSVAGMLTVRLTDAESGKTVLAAEGNIAQVQYESFTAFSLDAPVTDSAALHRWTLEITAHYTAAAGSLALGKSTAVPAGFGTLTENGETAAGALALLAAASLCTGLLMDAALVRQGLAVLRDPAAAAAAAQQSKGYEPLTANEERGMDWLARHAAPGELAATNRIHTGLAAEGLSNVYSGLSGCAFYMESFKYAVSNMGVPAAEVQARLAVNTALFDADTTAPQLRRLAAAHGIRYLAYCPRFPGSDKALAGFARVYESADLVIYRID